MANKNKSKISHVDYDINSKLALNNSGSFINNAFFSGFWHVNSPTQLTHDNENSFWKLVDSHHEGRLNILIKNLLQNTISAAEAAHTRQLVDAYHKFCNKYKLPFTVRATAIWSALYQSRVIECVYLPKFKKNNLLTNLKRLAKPKDGLPALIPWEANQTLNECIVYEIGPGSGLLSALLVLKGAKVFSIETVQSHYCYQSAFYSSMFGGSFQEAAHDSEFKFSVMPDTKIVHLPWWKILAFKDNAFPKSNVVTSNHMLMECSEFAVKHYVSFVNSILKDVGSWIFEGLGQMYRGGATYDQLTEKAIKYGFTVYDLRSIFKHFGVWVISKTPLEAIYSVPRGMPLMDFLADLIKEYPDESNTDIFRISNEIWLEMIDEGDSFQGFGV